MAKVYPGDWGELIATAAAERKLQTLTQLAPGLDDTYTVYRGVHWTHVERNRYAIFGGIDFAIVGPGGNILLIEQKAGVLCETPGGLAKKFAGKEKSVPSDPFARKLALTTEIDSDSFASKLAPTIGRRSGADRRCGEVGLCD
jgi:hypothetical protein